MDIEKIRNEIRKKFWGALLLKFLSFIYYFLFITKKKGHDIGLLKVNKYSKPVICVGNISSGGTGKTTFVISISKKLSNIGIRHTIVLRGYKSESKYNDIIDLNDTNFDRLMLDPAISDESKLIALSLKGLGVPVISSKNRKKSIEFAIHNYNPQLIIMDDGFQNFSIKKDLSIVIINLNMIEDFLLPFGNLRESYNGIKRADFIILNHCELFEKDFIKKSVEKISKYSNKKIIEAFYKPWGFLDLIKNEKIILSKFKWKEVAIFSGIGDNSQFKKLLEKYGFIISKSWQFSDHHKYSIQELESINKIRESLPLITTLKDAVKFYSRAKEIFREKIYALDVDIVIDDTTVISKIQEISK
ncbi:MAG: tetraacyldisaccharide 4'-kinase [Elusimicrobiota bacterium]